MEEIKKNMKCYRHVGTVYRELEKLGYDLESELKVEDLVKFDQIHYHGSETVAKCIEKLQICESSKVLDVGSGLGGPARYLAYKSGCTVTGIELQKDLNTIARDLTKRANLSDRVSFIEDNFMEMDLESLPKYDCVVSWLVFLHIKDKKEVLRRCFQCLKPGGKIYVEDYTKNGPFPENEKEMLSKEVHTSSSHLLTQEEYIQELKNVGFVNLEYSNETEDWSKFVKERSLKHLSIRKTYEELHGEEAFENMKIFYETIVSLFEGSLGGCKYTAQRPLE